LTPQYVRSCYSEVPVDPPDFLPENYTLYTTSLNYICFNTSQPLSVLGELIRYPASEQLNDAFASHKFDAGLNLPVGQLSAVYPGPLRLARTLDIVYNVKLSRNPSFSARAQTTRRRVSTRSSTSRTHRCPTIYASPLSGRAPQILETRSTRYKDGLNYVILECKLSNWCSFTDNQWWLCYSLRKHGYGNMTSFYTGADLNWIPDWSESSQYWAMRDYLRLKRLYGVQHVPVHSHDDQHSTLCRHVPSGDKASQLCRHQKQ
jgi:hypothetical protein